MSQTLQFEIDPLRISGDFVGSVLVAVDVMAYSREDYPRPDAPVCLIAAAHTGGLSSISKAYTKLFIAGAPTLQEERLIMRDFAAYLDMFDGGTLAAHYGASDQEDEGFDVPYLLARAKSLHPEVYVSLRRPLNKLKRHDTCAYVKENMNLPSAELDYVESYYGLARKPDAIIPDVKAAMDSYWRSGDASALKSGLANAYNCLRIAQSQIKKNHLLHGHSAITAEKMSETTKDLKDTSVKSEIYDEDRFSSRTFRGAHGPEPGPGKGEAIHSGRA